jgi:hypothetical protein
MRNPTPRRPLTLHLSPPGSDKHLRLSFTGTLSDERSQESRRRLLGLSALWCSPEPLRVVLSADESGAWAWAERWATALEDVVGGTEVRFVVRGARHGS